MSLDLMRDVFQPVFLRITERRDSLREVKRLTNVGIEGWFKVEIVAALGERVSKLNNKGPDLTLKDQTKIEIKAATNFAKSWCVIDPIKKYGFPVLFLADGSDTEKFTDADDAFEVIGCEVVFDGANSWLLGMAKPKS